MFRYCKQCQKEYDFKISSVKDLENLTFPECGSPIPKDSRRPSDNLSGEGTEAVIGKAYSGAIRFAFVMFLICEMVGLVAFFFKWNVVLYVGTAMGGVAYVFIYGWLNVIYIILGGFLGLFIWNSLPGICLGILVVMFVRRVLSLIIWNSISAFVKWSRM